MYTLSIHLYECTKYHCYSVQIGQILCNEHNHCILTASRESRGGDSSGITDSRTVISLANTSTLRPEIRDTHTRTGHPGETSVLDKNKCHICRAMYKSRKDIKGEKGCWVGCNNGRGKNRCNYWVHSHSIGIYCASKDDLKSVKYYCTSHICFYCSFASPSDLSRLMSSAAEVDT
jgi:hypothetical protein